MNEGVIVGTKGRNIKEQVWTASKEGTIEDIPMIVLVDQYSASASEIVAAALQDHERAVIVGNRTWGKGSVQNIIELEGGKSALKLTTASYTRPTGKNIHRFKGDTDDDEWGVIPDAGFKIVLSGQEMRDLVNWNFRTEIIHAGGATPEQADPFFDRQLQRGVENLIAKIANKAKK